MGSLDNDKALYELLNYAKSEVMPGVAEIAKQRDDALCRIAELEDVVARLTKELGIERCERKSADDKLNELTRNLDAFAGIARPYADQIEHLFAEVRTLRKERDTYFAQSVLDAGHEATIARLTQERDAALAKVAEFENVQDFPAELQVKCLTFTPDSLHRIEFINISKTLYAELRRDRERLDMVEAFEHQYTGETYRSCHVILAPGKTLRETLDEYAAHGIVPTVDARKAGA